MKERFSLFVGVLLLIILGVGVVGALAPFNGDVTGFVSAEGGVVSGSTTGDFNTIISGTLTGGVEGQWATFSGTISGDISGNMTGEVNYNGYDTLSAEITGSGASGYVYLIGGFEGAKGEFIGRFVTQAAPINFVTDISIAGDNSVEVGSTAQMSATTSPEGASQEVAWAVYVNDLEFATIDKDTGLLTGKSVGSVTVIASALDGSLKTKNYPVTIIADATAPTLSITGFTADGNGMTPQSGGYVLNTNNDANTNYEIQFASESMASEDLKTEVVGLFLSPTEGQTATLVKYYLSKPPEYQTYLNDAAAGNQPFAYIKTSGTTIKLLDGAQYTLSSGTVEKGMIVPGNYPLGTYTVIGQIKDVAGNEKTVIFNLIIKILLPEQQKATEETTTLEENTTEVIFDSDSASVEKVVIPQEISSDTEIKLDLSALKNGTEVNTSASSNLTLVREGTNNYSAVIPAGTTIKGDASWDGKIILPTIKPSSSYSATGANVDVVIKLGGISELNFSKPVKVIIGGMAGKKAGWTKGTGALTEITTYCDSTDTAPGNIDNITNRECYTNSNDGKDLVIWTYHFTSFAAITPIVDTTTSSSSGGGYCSTKWTCTEWSTCTNNVQTRTCSYPSNFCTPTATKPIESQSCTYVAPIAVNLPIENTALPEEQTTTPKGGAPITGGVIGNLASPKGIGIIIFILIIIGLIVILKVTLSGSKKI
jgi:hypothetical protein